MKRAFRWGCVVLTLVAVGAWALLLHQSKQPWKLIGVNEMSDPDGRTGLAYEKQTEKQNAISNSKSRVMPPGEGDRTFDPVVAQQQHRKQDSVDLHDARLLFMGPGPVAPKTRHHCKKHKDTGATSEEKQETDDDAVSSGDNAATNAALLSQTLIIAGVWPSTAIIPPNDASPVMKTTQTVVERISAPIGTTANDLSQGITSVTQPRLQGLITTTPSTISQTTSHLASPVNNIGSSPLQTLTSQTLNTLSSPTSTVPSVTSATSTVGANVSGVGISPTSSTSTSSTSSISTPTLVPTTITTVVTTPNFGPAAAGPVSNISSSLSTSGPTSLSSSLLAPTSGLPKVGSRGR